MNEIDVHKDIFYREGGIISKVIEQSAKTNTTLFCMAAGTAISEHTASAQALVYVIEGKGTFTLENKPLAMTPGKLIYFGPDTKHSLRATENTSFLLILAK